MSGPLAGIRVFDLSRILAGPTATQILGDLGADVIKIERPGAGDDTRKWGPPFVKDADGKDTHESGYYLSINRNKRSVTLDVAKPEGQEIAKRLIARSDIFVENFKVGDMARYGLAYEQIKYDFPRLIYCSITGFGQTGPYAHRAGYDFIVQAMSGFMSLTGEPDGAPARCERPHSHAPDSPVLRRRGVHLRAVAPAPAPRAAPRLPTSFSAPRTAARRFYAAEAAPSDGKGVQPVPKGYARALLALIGENPALTALRCHWS